MKVIFIIQLVYGIGNKTFYGCVYRKIKDPLILGELPEWCSISKNRKDGLPWYLKKNRIQTFWNLIVSCHNVTGIAFLVPEET